MRSGRSRSSGALLTARDVHKRFGTQAALCGAELEVEAGEIHALLGENGAGKTTLMNVLYGMIGADRGSIRFAGAEHRPRSPREAIARGVAMVHQHFTLVPGFTAAENLALGEPSAWLGLRLDRRRAARRLLELGRATGLEIDPGARARDLSVGARQRLEILKALHSEPRLLILDEPTSILAPQEIEPFFAALRQLKQSGTAVLFISHKLAEIEAIADRVTVLRQGRTVLTAPAAQASRAELTAAMVGPETSAPVRAPAAVKPDPICLDVSELTLGDGRGGRARHPIRFNLRYSEILGVAGIQGHGQEELIATLLGHRPAPRHALRWSGATEPVAYIPDDRRAKGLIAELPLWENLILRDHARPPLSRRGILNRAAARRWAAQQLAALRIERDPEAPAATLSGGNQQRLVVARELSGRPSLVIAENPTQGLDVAAAAAVQRRLLQARDQGAAILLVSTDLDEILELSDRIGVLHRGSLTVLAPGAATRERIGALMLGLEA